ncbi:hypothetical protein ACP70R_045425 [Stipagrostis hirtigluma subsp. patula]
MVLTARAITQLAMKALVLTAFALAYATVTTGAGQCGVQLDVVLCPDNQCCSKWGYCGLGPLYCGAGCQSGACLQGMRCGRQNRGAGCPGNLCCSPQGYCGIGQVYCGNGCQSGPCHASIPCGGNKGCPGDLCCGKWGYCGLGPEFCGEGCQSGPCCAENIRCGRQANGAKCPYGYCCGPNGECGLGLVYCAQGCQSGPCRRLALNGTEGMEEHFNQTALG